jgi:hypothetical protein
MNETEMLEVAERLESSMDNLAGEVARQADEVARQDAYGHRNRQLIWGLVASVLLNLVIGVVAIGASLQAREATSQAKRNAENARISCEVGNEGRRLQTQLWTYVLDLSSQNPNLTAYQKKQIAMFRGYIATTYAPRDCNATPTAPPSTVTPSR